MIDILAGGVVGAISRLIVEITNIFDKRNEREHELAMTQLNIEYAKLNLDYKAREIESAQEVSYQELRKAAIESQFNSGIPIIDALSQSVRPILTYSFSFMYFMSKIAIFNMQKEVSGYNEAALSIMGPWDKTILGWILGYWFVGRTFPKCRK